MVEITQEITLDVDKQETFKFIFAKQGDANSRKVKITLMKNGSKIIAESSSETAYFRAKKPDNTSVYNKAEINDDGTITIALTQQTLAVKGIVDADVSIKSENGEILSSASFKIEVCEAPLGDNIPSSNEFLVLQDLIETANSTVEEITQMKNNGDFKGDTGPQGPQGEQGPPGEDYVLTEQDKKDIAKLVNVPPEKIIKIADVITTEEIASFETDTDMDGNPFSVNNLLIILKAKATSSNPGKNSWRLYCNNNLDNAITGIRYNNVYSNTDDYSSIAIIKRLDSDSHYSEWSGSKGFTDEILLSTPGESGRKFKTIKTNQPYYHVLIRCEITGLVLGVGSEIKIWGW